MEETVFKSNYFYRMLRGQWNPFRPNVITINDEFLEYKRRNWHLISEDTQVYYFQNVTGIFIDKHIFGATIRIVLPGNQEYVSICGFSKRNADAIKAICQQAISKNTQKGAAQMMANAMAAGAAQPAAGQVVSVVEELKGLKELLDQGVLTQEEFEARKAKILAQ